jgi:ketosteroid isomerase-like protein
MAPNETIITQFYTAFQQLDYKGMRACYSPDIVFSDPVFGLLNAAETNAMWEMLCTNARDFSLSFGNIQLLDEEYATADWVAVYTFSATGRKVVNRIKAHMRLKDGLIIEHSDAFPLYRWTRQAFGIPGLLFGWSSFMQNRIQLKARLRLRKFMLDRGYALT